MTVVAKSPADSLAGAVSELEDRVRRIERQCSEAEVAAENAAADAVAYKEAADNVSRLRGELDAAREHLARARSGYTRALLTQLDADIAEANRVRSQRAAWRTKLTGTVDKKRRDAHQAYERVMNGLKGELETARGAEASSEAAVKELTELRKAIVAASDGDFAKLASLARGVESTVTSHLERRARFAAVDEAYDREKTAKESATESEPGE